MKMKIFDFFRIIGFPTKYCGLITTLGLSVKTMITNLIMYSQPAVQQISQKRLKFSTKARWKIKPLIVILPNSDIISWCYKRGCDV